MRAGIAGLMLGLGASLAAGPATAASCAATAGLAWPGEHWEKASPARPDAVVALEAYAFPDGLDEAAREGIRTNAVVAIRGGRLVYEHYARGFGRDQPHIEWSATKSVVSALIGRAVALGHLASVDEPVGQWLPELAQGPKAGMTIADLLHMSSGLAYDEAYEFAPLWSDVIAMLYTRGHDDMARYTALRRLAAPPGTRWSYSSGDSVLLAAALRGIMGEAAYPTFPWDALFDPLGMRGAVFERDAAGIFIGSSNLYLRPRDLARFGLLYARDGCWRSRRLLPEGWVHFTGELAPALRRPLEGGRWPAYGAHWWLNIPPPGGGWRRLPAAPEDALIADGHWGQYLVVVPSLDLVLVRNGDDRDGTFSLARFTALAIAAFAPEAAPQG